MIYQGGQLRLEPLGLWGEIIQTIRSEQYNQSDAINNTVRVIQSKQCNQMIWSEQSKQCNQQYGRSNTIKTIQLAIQSERLKRYGQQYGQNNQSNIVSNTIKINPGVVTLLI